MLLVVVRKGARCHDNWGIYLTHGSIRKKNLTSARYSLVRSSNARKGFRRCRDPFVCAFFLGGEANPI